MVDPEEFERVRAMLNSALDKAYEKYLVKPAELLPGYWELWPLRTVRLRLEETKIWTYGKPGGGTGDLQAHITWAYGNSERFKPKPSGSPFTEKLATRAAKMAEEISRSKREQLIIPPNGQEAYLFGYSTIVAMPAEKRERFWTIREPTYKLNSNWDPMHQAIHMLFFDSRKENPKEWDALFEGPQHYKSPRQWSPRERGYNERNYDMFSNGVVDAIDDWALETGRRRLVVE